MLAPMSNLSFDPYSSLKQNTKDRQSQCSIWLTCLIRTCQHTLAQSLLPFTPERLSHPGKKTEQNKNHLLALCWLPFLLMVLLMMLSDFQPPPPVFPLKGNEYLFLCWEPGFWVCTVQTAWDCSSLKSQFMPSTHMLIHESLLFSVLVYERCYHDYWSQGVWCETNKCGLVGRHVFSPYKSTTWLNRTAEAANDKQGMIKGNDQAAVKSRHCQPGPEYLLSNL